MNPHGPLTEHRGAGIKSDYLLIDLYPSRDQYGVLFFKGDLDFSHFSCVA